MVAVLPPATSTPLVIPSSFVPSPGPSTNETSPSSLNAFSAVLQPVADADDCDELRFKAGMAKRSPIPSLNDPDLRKKALTEALFGDSFGDPSCALEASPTTSETREHPYGQGALTLEDLTPIGRATSSPSPRPADDELVAAVSRQAAAATEALKSPTLTESGLKRKGTKNINGRLISTPQLVSSTTSFDTVPVHNKESSAASTASTEHGQAGEKQGLKLSLRIRKFRDKLKSSRGGAPNGDEITPWTFEAPPTPPAPARQLSATMQSSEPAPRQPSPVHEKSPRQPSPSPVTPRASAPSQQGIKNFVSRLRSNSKRDLSESSPLGRAPSLLSRTPSKKSSSSPKAEASLLGSPRKYVASEFTIEEEKTESNIIDLRSPQDEDSELLVDLGTPPQSEPAMEDPAVKQLFDAASSLGLDKDALAELLARSTSTSSKATGLTRSNTVNTTKDQPSRASSNDSEPLISGEGLKRAPSSRALADLSRVVEQQSSGSGLMVNGEHAVVRRTIIFPSENESALTRKGSVATAKTGRRQKRTSTTSMQSNRSLQERSPTPPPNRSSKRFSKDPSPPLPALPAQFSSGLRDSTPGNFLGQSARSQKTNSSAYGSL